MILKENSSLNIKLSSIDSICGTLSIATENDFYSVFIYFFVTLVFDSQGFKKTFV